MIVRTEGQVCSMTEMVERLARMVDPEAWSADDKRAGPCRPPLLASRLSQSHAKARDIIAASKRGAAGVANQ